LVIRRLLTAGVVSALVMGALLVVPQTATRITPSANAQSCPEVEVVFARGRLESPGVGILGNAFINALRSKSNKNIGTYAVRYPADSEVDDGAMFRPKDGAGSKMAAFNIRGAMLARDDFIDVDLEAERLDDGGWSKVTLRVANLLPYVALKIFAFQDRHQNKDSYDLAFSLFHAVGGPQAAGERAATSPVVGSQQVEEALVLLTERFANADQDGPHAYANFLASGEDPDESARLRQVAVATTRAFLRGLREARDRRAIDHA
jgi:hypothetical protein